MLRTLPRLNKYKCIRSSCIGNEGKTPISVEKSSPLDPKCVCLSVCLTMSVCLCMSDYVCLSMYLCLCIHRSGELIEPLYQVWEEQADTERPPAKTGQQVLQQFTITVYIYMCVRLDR